MSAASCGRPLPSSRSAGAHSFADLSALRIPALVVHGDSDPLIHASGGQATARAIPGARLVVVPGMGHDLPREAWPTVIDAVVDNARRAEA